MIRVLLFITIFLTSLTSLEAQFSINVQPAACYDSCNGRASVNTPAGTYHFTWNTGDTTRSITHLCAGNYSCVVSDVQGVLLDTLNALVQQPSSLVISAQVLKNETCYGDTDGLVLFSITGGTGSRYPFTWSNGYQGFLSDQSQFNLSAGNYGVTINDIQGCSASTSFAISQPTPIIVTPHVNNTTTCALCNGAITVTVSGPSPSQYTYSWSNQATSASVANLCQGGYGLTVSDSSGCTSNLHINVLSDNSNLHVSFSPATNIDCSHHTGFLYAAPSGGSIPYHYLWSTGATAPDIFNLLPGAYAVSVTDSAGCLYVATDTIINQGLLIKTIARQDFRCDVNSGKIIIALSGGSSPYSINWSNGALNTDTLNALRPGNYSVSVTDAHGCTAHAAYTIAQINTSLSTTTTGTAVNCLHGTTGLAIAHVTGGLAPYNYLWYSSPFQTADTAINLPVGNYQLRIIDAFGCLIFSSVNIAPGYQIVNTTSNIGNCDSAGSATATLTTGAPPYSYSWNTQPPQNTATALNLAPGNYSVSVTDSTGCVRTGDDTIQYNCAALVTGKIFYDGNANCHVDNNEQGIAGIPVYVTNNHISFEGTTNLSGDYAIAVNVAGGYKIVLGVSASSAVLQYGNSACGFMQACPANDSITLTNLRDTLQNYNFGFAGSSDYDLAVNAGWTPVDANHVKQYWALYANEAFLRPFPGMATITMYYDSNLTFQSGNPPPVDNAAAHTLTWLVDSLPSPTFDWAHRVSAFFKVPAGLPSDYPLKNSFNITPASGDCDTTNNTVYISEIAGLPFKAISKEVSPAGDLYPSDSVLTYIIHFQNTGTDTAGIIRITDTLSPYLDPATIQNIACYPLFNQFFIAPGAVPTWVFNAANLPSSLVNALSSAGFVSFTVKVKPGTGTGYVIKNHASVKIDNNAALLTDTTYNLLTGPTSLIEPGEAKVTVRIFPNPFSGQTNVAVDGTETNYDFDLADLTGRRIKSLTSISARVFLLNCEGLNAGVYVYSIASNGQLLAHGKIVVQ